MKKFKVFALVFAIMLSATGLGLLFGSNQPASTQAKVSAEDATNTITVTFDAGDGSFGDGTKQNVATYKSERKTITKYSHTSNIDDAGVANGTYANNLSNTDTVIIPGATSLQIDVWYSTEDTSCDWLAIYPKGVTPTSSNYAQATISDGKLGDGGEYEKENATPKTFTVNGDTAIFYFQSNSSSCYYGYYAVVSGEGYVSTPTSDEVKQPTPTKDGYFFAGWTDDTNNQNVVKYAKDLSDFGSDKDVTLYAVYADFSSLWNYKLDNTVNTISLTKYKGAETTYKVPAKTTIGDKEYSVIFGSGSPEEDTAQVSLGTITNLSFDEGVQFPTNSSYLFYGSGLVSLNLSGVNTSNVTDMGSMFSDCSALTSLDLSKFNTSNVTNMDSMFYDCRLLTSINLSNFNTSKVEVMIAMFYGCSSLTSLDLSNFNTSKVKVMITMFSGCSKLTSLDLSSFDTSKITDMSSMFYGCSSLTNLDLSNFDTSNVTEMYNMFSGCSALTSLDLSKFNTSKVTNMSFMLSNCSSLTSLDLSNFDASNVTNMRGMFYGNTSLQNIKMPNTMNAESGIFLRYLDLPSKNASNESISWYSLASGDSKGILVKGILLTDTDVSANTYADKILTIYPNKSYAEIDKIIANATKPSTPETPSTGVVLDVVLPVASIVLVLASLVAVAFVGKKKKQY